MAVLKRNKIIKFSIILFVILQKLSLHSQIDTLNRTNDKGLKIGYWKTYYNLSIEPIQDTTKAIYCGFEYYIDGDLFRYVLYKNPSGRAKIKYFPKDNIIDKEKLNGYVLYYDKDNNIAYKDEFVDGQITKTHCFSYFLDQGKFNLFYEELADFTRRYSDNKNSFYFEKKEYKVLKDVWKVKKGYVIYKNKNKRKIIKI